MGKPKSALPDTSYTPSTLPPAHIVVQLGPPQGSGNFTCTDADGVERLVEIGGKVKRSKVLVTRGEWSVHILTFSSLERKRSATPSQLCCPLIWRARHLFRADEPATLQHTFDICRN